MSYFISLTAIFMAVFALTYIANKKVEILFPIVNLGTIFAHYFFGLCNILFAGGFVLLAASLILFGFALFKIIKNKDANFVKQFFSPLMILLIIFSVGQYIALFNMEVVSWDELTHWGLVVKNMFYYRNFGGGTMATTMFKGYPVGSSLYLYFFEMFGVSFQPAHLYMAMNLLNISLLLPVLSKFKNHKQKLIMFGFLVLTTLIFNYKMFFSIWNDTFLSLAFAYVLISYFCFIKNEGLEKIHLLSIILGTFALVSSKSTGLILVIFAFVIIGLDLLINRREVLKANKKKSLIAIVLIALSIIIPKITWSFYLKTIEVGGAWQTSNLTIKNIFKYFTQPTNFQIEVTKKFFLTFLWPFKNTGNAGSAPIPFVLDILLMISLILVIKKKKDGKNGLALSLGIFLCFAAYIVGTLISYLFTFSQEEALKVASFVRYMNTFVVGILIFLIAYIFSLFQAKEETKLNFKILGPILSSVLILCFACNPIVIYQMKNKMSEYQVFISGINKLERDDRIYIIDTTEDLKQYLMMRFIATPIDTSGLKIGGSPHIGDVWNISLSTNEVENHIIKENYNYLYLHNINNEFIASYSSMFNVQPENNTFYRIIINDAEVYFENFNS